MIHVNRTSVPTPAPLKGTNAPAAKERAEAIAFYQATANRDKSFEYKVYKDEEVKDALNTLFHFKCAYCESYFGATQPVDVEHYRPKGGVIINGSLTKPGYFWLAADWKNLLPSCIDCNRKRTHKAPDGTSFKAGKANLFPIKNESKRANKPGEEAKEQRLLLDPCRDKPESHLAFGDEGVVTAVTKSGNKPSQKGENSINVYGLQRRGLVQARRDRLLLIQAQIRRVANLIDRLDRIDNTNPLRPEIEADLTIEMEELEKFQHADKPYAGMARQFIKRFFASLS